MLPNRVKVAYGKLKGMVILEKSNPLLGSFQKFAVRFI